jgi:beta-phosphoglucomutase family hydrolase
MTMQQTPIQAIIFDLDGTLIDSMPFHTQSWVIFAKHHGIEMDLPELMRRTTGRNGAECMNELLGREVPTAQAWEMVAEKEAIYRELFAPQFKAVLGAQAFISAARESGLKLGLGTAGDAHNVAFALQHLALPREFDAIARGDEGLPGKPDPAIFLAAAQRMGMLPQHCVVFEDAPLGIEAARRAGMQAVAVCTGHSAAELAGPHVLASIANYTELRPDFLRDMRGLDPQPASGTIQG